MAEQIAPLHRTGLSVSVGLCAEAFRFYLRLCAGETVQSLDHPPFDDVAYRRHDAADDAELRH